MRQESHQDTKYKSVNLKVVIWGMGEGGIITRIWLAAYVGPLMADKFPKGTQRVCLAHKRNCFFLHSIFIPDQLYNYSGYNEA